MTQRTMVLFLLAVLAASPLMWMSVDPNAGNTLLSFTSRAKAQLPMNNQSAFGAPAR